MKAINLLHLFFSYAFCSREFNGRTADAEHVQIKQNSETFLRFRVNRYIILCKIERQEKGIMRSTSQISEKIVVAFVVLFALLFSSTPIFAQCGNYFKTNYSAISKAGSVKLDDWTGDNRSDVWHIRGNPNNSLLDIVIYPSKATGYWDWDNPIIYTTPVSFVGIDQIVVDLDSDGRMDFVSGSGSFQILRNAGNGSFTVSSVLNDTDGSLQSSGNIGFLDINGDGLLDWLYIIDINGTARIRYQLQNPDGSFANKATILTGSGVYGNSFVSNKLGDFDGDGKVDLVYNAPIGNTIKSVLIKNLGNGNFQIGTPVEQDLFVFRVPVKDFNNDGRDDILSRNIIFYGRADGTFDRVPLPGGSPVNYNMVPAKLNGDNNWDIVEINSDSYAAYISDGAGGFSRTVYQHNFGTSSRWKFEDFSGDGKADLYIADVKYNIFGEGVFWLRGNTCRSFGETKFANFDGNNIAEVATWRSNNGNWSSKNAVWNNSGNANAAVQQWGLGSLGDVPAPGDFDGDGKTDYAVYRTNSGVWYILRSSDSSWVSISFGITGDIAVPNDYDGGGTNDIAVFRPSDGNWYIRFSETQEFQTIHFGASGDKPVPADYDGDGKTDLAVYRPSSGNWYSLKSSDGNFTVRSWGIESDKPVPADYDGDGRADHAIYRDGVWWILKSSDNSSVAIAWGTAGDIPVPVYRNSISADLTYYRPSNSRWYSLDYNYLQGIQLGADQDVPVYFGLPNN